MPLPRFTIRGFKPPREAVLTSLGSLERRTLDEVWRRNEVCVKDVVDAFDDRFAYTTVMTTLDRLYKKGYLERRKIGRAFAYSAKWSRQDLQIGMAGDFIAGLIDRATGGVEPVLACIVDAVSEKDRELLHDLERLVNQKKAELQDR
jgi:predicted transcriptional regulator